MDPIQEKYQRYLDKATQHEKELYLYESKMQEAKQYVERSLSELDTDVLAQFGIHLDIDLSRLDEIEYQIQTMNKLKETKAKLDDLAMKLLEEV